MELRRRFITELNSRYGYSDDLESLVDFLIPSRDPLFGAEVSFRISDAPELDRHYLDYSVEFQSALSEVLFAISPTHDATESTLASLREVTEITTLAGGESMADDGDDILAGLRIYARVRSMHGTTRTATLPFRELTTEQIQVLPSQAAGLPDSTAQQIRCVRAKVPPSTAGLPRIGISFRRKIPKSVLSVPWVADRPVLLNRISLDVNGCVREPVRCGLFPFMATDEGAFSRRSRDARRIDLVIASWVYVGQGFVASWAPDNSDMSILGMGA